MPQKRGKISTGIIVSLEMMTQFLAEAGESTLDAGRQHHAEQVQVARHTQTINAPLMDLLRNDAAALQATRDLRTLLGQPEVHRPVFPTIPVPIPPFPPLIGSNIIFFTPSAYAGELQEGQG